MSRKITNLTIKVPYKRAGNAITQKDVEFDVFEQDHHYKLIPCLSQDERRIANLPEELVFTIEDGHPVSSRGKMDGNFHVIEDAVTLLQQKQLL